MSQDSRDDPDRPLYGLEDLRNAGKTPCPGCGEEMQPGYLAAPSRPPWGGIKWFEDQEFKLTVMGGEELAPSAVLNAATYLRAYRCPNCRLILLGY